MKMIKYKNTKQQQSNNTHKTRKKHKQNKK